MIQKNSQSRSEIKHVAGRSHDHAVEGSPESHVVGGSPDPTHENRPQVSLAETGFESVEEWDGQETAHNNQTAHSDQTADNESAQHRPIQLTNIAIPIAAVHLLALFAFWPAFICWQNFVLLIVCVLVFGQGMNLGYHRLLAHRSLKVPKWIEYLYVSLALCSLEESPGKWVSTHRRHHNHSDEHHDPHSPDRGFVWSHFGWLLFKRNGEEEFRVDERYSADILSDPFYAALEKNPLLPGVIYLMHAVLFYLFCWAILVLIGSDTGSAAISAMGATLWGVVLRTVVVWHITWSVNSLSHIFGYQNYQTGEESRNNWLVALLASGEGWHNNHHADPASASVQHKWWEFDVTYYHILVLEFLGLASQVVRPRHVRTRDSNER